MGFNDRRLLHGPMQGVTWIRNPKLKLSPDRHSAPPKPLFLVMVRRGLRLSVIVFVSIVSPDALVVFEVVPRHPLELPEDGPVPGPFLKLN